MFRALEIAASGMTSEQAAMNAVSNNLSNVDTTGFKASHVQFEELVTTDNTNGTFAPQGTQVAATDTDSAQGSIVQTGNTWDLAINGNGYFVLNGAGGQQVYTRAGNFNVNAQGQIVNPNGLALAGGVSVPLGEQNVTVGPDGTVYGTPAGGSQQVALGQIQLAAFANPQGLSDQGQGVFSPTAASGPALTPNASSAALGLGTVEQGALEQSNVNMVQEMVDMITTQRAYESGAKVINAADQMLSYANGLVR